MNPTLIGSSVDVVGTTDNQRGRQCDKHLVCGEALVVGSYVFFRRAQFAWRAGVVEDVLEVYSSFDGNDCKVGYLLKHLAGRADVYDGLCARVVEIYSAESEVTAKRQKFHRNKGCCVALIIDAGIDVVGGDVGRV
jgi:hypothetical protein